MRVVLEIGDRSFTAEDLIPLMKQYQMLPKLAQEIIIDRAIAKIEYSEQEKTLAHNKFCQQNQLLTEEQLQAWLKQQDMTSAQLDQLIERRLKIEKFKQDTWGNKVESYFIKRKSQLDRVVYSLIRTDKAEVAQELYFRITEGENTFSELAMEFSLGSEAQTGGLIGPVEINAPHPQIARILSTSKPGQVIPPTRVGEWLVIIRLENYISAKLDQSMRQRMLDEMFREWLNEEINQTVSFPDNTPSAAIS
ncbi:PpiC-type peptidyl-prolyl cis-trans isomerase [Stanieria cyanosphaera PCC 7437]|uniref:peptidylprolyl isomerase n=1 Tax=Stanieria cyanosphaera (strain ATCC 29371 / PCC 7437) TaxID=111780 RepID=K9XSG8_STAC7|nr:peptidylprolyl isomerase [Stanieria cyanosphaera]AFZ35483.1 PpiC-type peptidyl-prolyl cis-trans isomerase [Stanieria cyanosphaera PCC 7437]